MLHTRLYPPSTSRRALVRIHDEVLAKLESSLGVRPAQTKRSDADGVLALSSIQPGVASVLFRSYRNPPPPSSSTSALPTPPPLRSAYQVAARYRLPDGSVRIYTKTSAAPLDDWPTPQLDIELGGDAKELIFYVGLGPRSFTADFPYVEHYMHRPPPPHPLGTGTNGTNDGSASAPAPAPRSLLAIEAEAQAQPGFSPFVSPSMWVRGLSASALCFTVAWDAGRDAAAMAAVRSYAHAVTDTWLAHLMADAQTLAAVRNGTADANSGGKAVPPPPAAAAASDPWVVEQWRRAAAALRESKRNDPATPMMVPVFGQEQVDKWVELSSGL
ncbi:hypothetical protein HYH03_001231 [Edaphochlamys debaryana]|uniref:Uncharacterized protein n=1 Tax=Edaphochlamys debaryana TaxID=47281 RepID=A0A835YEN3_9CHLO|nr:hypothetical protein HYH03_001231 [Edaphochlamys debaryana]|eukprot:KAG2501450.1 hypothetical protein HYH03_001231 [Edaphochlamys debaryana]